MSDTRLGKRSYGHGDEVTRPFAGDAERGQLLKLTSSGEVEPMTFDGTNYEAEDVIFGVAKYDTEAGESRTVIHRGVAGAMFPADGNHAAGDLLDPGFGSNTLITEDPVVHPDDSTQEYAEVLLR